MSKTPGSGKEQHLAESLTPARITWNELQVPVSTAFDDVYYSKANGLEETRYVFLQSNRVAERWHKLADDKSTGFTIVETGFGTGLNFLATCRAWQQSNLQQAWLHFVSIEKYPLTPDDLKLALAQWPELADLTNLLLGTYPPLVPGFHRLEFPGLRVRLTLVFDDVHEAMPQLNLQADAWYLDGFAPSKNPDMWQDSLYQQMARLSRAGATFATFTAAGVVRRGLQAAGFSVEKAPGFGHKRDMLVGCLPEPLPEAAQLPVSETPWYIRSKPAPSSATDSLPTAVKTALVIGAGLAGCNTARALAERGIRVTVADRHPAIAADASGNPAGITFTKLSPFDTPQNRFYQKAYLYAISRLEQQLPQSDLVPGRDYGLNGVLRFAFSEKEQQEQDKLVQSGLWPASFATALDAPACSALLGFPSDLGGFYLRKGGWLTPADWCRLCLDHPDINLFTNTRITGMQWQQDHWEATTEADNLQADAVVVANSFGAGELEQFRHLPLRSVRGQITYVPATENSRHMLQQALNYDGYITPAKQGFHCVGATFQPNCSDPEFYPQDHQKNLESFRKAVPWLFAEIFQHANASAEPFVSEEPANSAKPWPLHQGRVAFRCQSPDYLPLIGPAPDPAAFLEDYGDLRRGMVKKPYPTGRYLPRCYLNLAHGSRGITSSLLGAEIIASDLCGEPAPIDREVLHAIHPARFLIRDLRRNKI